MIFHVRSLFSFKLQDIRDDTRNSSCCCVCCTDTCEKIRNNCDAVKLGGIGVLIFLMIIPLAALIVGQVYKKECPIEPWVSLWMTVFGAVGVGSFGLMIIVVSRILFITWMIRTKNLEHNYHYLVRETRRQNVDFRCCRKHCTCLFLLCMDACSKG